MSEAVLVAIGIALACCGIAIFNWMSASAPTRWRVERRRREFLRARALYLAEAAALHAYYQAAGPVKAQQDAAQMASVAVQEAGSDVR